jgi:hypothetical protein
MAANVLDYDFHLEYRIPATTHDAGFRDFIGSFQPNSGSMFRHLTFIQNVSGSNLHGVHVIWLNLLQYSVDSLQTNAGIPSPKATTSQFMTHNHTPISVQSTLRHQITCDPS